MVKILMGSFFALDSAYLVLLLSFLNMNLHAKIGATCRQGDIAGMRYDSVYGIHDFHKTPIYVTYNAGHAYPKFLITYMR